IRLVSEVCIKVIFIVIEVVLIKNSEDRDIWTHLCLAEALQFPRVKFQHNDGFFGYVGELWQKRCPLHIPPFDHIPPRSAQYWGNHCSDGRLPSILRAAGRNVV